jgi:hypothetical protein
MTFRWLILGGIGTLLVVGKPHVAGADAADQGAAPTSSLKEENYRGIRYVTGGVGQREQEEIAALANDYDALIILSNEAGAYLSGVELAFRDEQGKPVLLATTRGPFFLVDLPDGRYKVEARRPSAPIEHRSLTVRGGKTQTLHFALPVKTP